MPYLKALLYCSAPQTTPDILFLIYLLILALAFRESKAMKLTTASQLLSWFVLASLHSRVSAFRPALHECRTSCAAKGAAGRAAWVTPCESRTGRLCVVQHLTWCHLARVCIPPPRYKPNAGDRSTAAQVPSRYGPCFAASLRCYTGLCTFTRSAASTATAKYPGGGVSWQSCRGTAPRPAAVATKPRPPAIATGLLRD